MMVSSCRSRCGMPRPPHACRRWVCPMALPWTSLPSPPETKTSWQFSPRPPSPCISGSSSMLGSHTEHIHSTGLSTVGSHTEHIHSTGLSTVGSRTEHIHSTGLSTVGSRTEQMHSTGLVKRYTGCRYFSSQQY